MTDTQQETATTLEPALGKLRSAALPLVIEMPGGRKETIGEGEPILKVRIHNDRGLAAVGSLKELEIVDAYLDGDLDLEGDLLAGMKLREVLRDVEPWTRAWTFLEPALKGRKRLNPDWVAKHYDSENMQLFAVDEEYQVYTPGLYLSDDDSLEESAERKLEYAFDALGLEEGDSVLDVGAGWGGFARFCARRGVRYTGISLSRHQLGFAEQKLADEGLSATLLYQDFFTYEPAEQFDAISLMGSIEELSNYRKVMRRLERWLKPGGLVYLDFAAADRPFGIASFVTKYVWPGAFRMVYLPAFTRALARSHFDVVEMENDRRNYYLWAKNGYEQWMRRKDEILEHTDERTWRLMRLLTAGTAHLMSDRSIWATAYRVVLERRTSPRRARATARGEATLAAGSRP
jgi:cyclopropane-fatty-acyl-phospholipid synthase